MFANMNILNDTECMTLFSQVSLESFQQPPLQTQSNVLPEEGKRRPSMAYVF